MGLQRHHVLRFSALFFTMAAGIAAGPPVPGVTVPHRQAVSPKQAVAAAQAGSAMTKTNAVAPPVVSRPLFTNTLSFTWSAVLGSNPTVYVVWTSTNQGNTWQEVGSTVTTSVNVVSTNVPNAWFKVVPVPESLNGNANWRP
jgi:hypothetical protein